MDRIVLLHLSDLHFGQFSRFPLDEAEGVGDLLAEAVVKELNSIGGGPVDLVVVTGDIAEMGLPDEFKAGGKFLGRVGEKLGIERRRFVFVPGNHDISWTACKRAEAELQEKAEEDGQDIREEDLRAALDAVKLERYYGFIASHYEKPLSAVARPLKQGAFLYLYEELGLSVGALNSCEQESHRKEDHVGRIGREQAQSLLDAWQEEEAIGKLKILAVHHNPVMTTLRNAETWRAELLKLGKLSPELLTRYEADVLGLEGAGHVKAIVEDSRVQLVLHGHHHVQDTQSWLWRSGGEARILSSGSLSLKSEKLLSDQPASLRLVALEAKRKQLRTRTLVYEPRYRPGMRVEKGSFVPDPAETAVLEWPLFLPPDFGKGSAGRRTARKATKNEPAGFSPDLLHRFRQRLSAKFSSWNLAFSGVIQAGRGSRPIWAALDSMYLQLRLGQEYNPDKTEGTLLQPQELLNRKKPLIIRGAGGTGKTTWIRWTFRRLLEDEKVVPLLLILRDELTRRWQDPQIRGADRSLDAVLAAWLAKELGLTESEAEAEIRRLLSAETGPRPVLLVDGWDEVGPLGNELREKLLGLMKAHPRVLVVVTSRPYGEGCPSHSDNFEVLDIQPLSDVDIASLAERFFRHCYGDEDAVASQAARDLLGSLERVPDAKSLARNALLLTMMLLIGRSRPLPDKRHLLYQACIDNLLTALPRRYEEQGVLVEQWRPSDVEERLRVVAALAARLQTQGYRQEYWRRKVTGTWEELAAFLPEWTADERLGFLSWLAGPAGLLADLADGTLCFSHLSFQEYLAAWHFNSSIEGPDERVEEFFRYLDSPQWWETLRLWGALIETVNPTRLEPVLDALLDSQIGMPLAGVMMADGLGRENYFGLWAHAFVLELGRGSWSGPLENCARAWFSSRQHERKNHLFQECTRAAPGAMWAGWLRLNELVDMLGFLPPPRPTGASPSGAILATLLDSDGNYVEAVAAGRFLCGASPLWPVVPPVCGFLQAWLSGRRMIGLRAQLAATCGAGLEDLKSIVLRSLDGLKREADKSFTLVLARYFSRYFHRALALEFARYFSLYFSLYSDRDLVFESARTFAPDFARNFARNFDGDFDSEVALDLARAFVRFFSRASSRDSVDAFACSLGVDPQSLWFVTFEQLELASYGRVSARVSLAGLSLDLHQHEVEIQLLAPACRLSLQPETDPAEFREAEARLAPTLHPLWPALARHLARLSTQEDRDLLIDLAQNPQKAPEPLSWGLRYIVRGDVVLNDGTIVTLDEITDRAGVPRMPYLDEMPPELEIDWGAED